MSTALPLIFDVHLDLAMNAMEFNRDLRWTHERIRRRELEMNDQACRSRHTVCFPEMRRGNVGLCEATQIARSISYFSRMPGWFSPEQAWAQTQGQLAWYREMEAGGELRQIRDRRQLEEHLREWSAQADGGPKVPIGYVLSLEGADSIVRPGH